eukprot:211875-Rhodomonas_salina.1
MAYEFTAMSGTELAYGATRCAAVLRQRMVLCPYQEASSSAFMSKLQVSYLPTALLRAVRYCHR